MGWRWIFWMNVPFGVAAIAFASLYMPATPKEWVAPLDVTGFILSGAGLSALVFGLTVTGRDLLPAPWPVLLILAGFGLVAAYVRHARLTAAPLLDLRLLGIATFRAGVVGGSLFRVGVGAVPFLLPLMFQLGYGMSALQSGTITCMAAAGALAMKFKAAWLIRRFGFRQLLIVNGGLASLSIAVMGFLGASTPFVLLASLLFAGGFLRSLQFTAMNAMSYADVSSQQASHATSLYAVAQQVSLAAGVVLAAFVLESAERLRGAAALTPDDFAIAFGVVAAVSLTALWQFRALTPDAGGSVSGRDEAATDR
jgi:MFS family permease